MSFWIYAALMLGVGIAALLFVLLHKRADIVSNQTAQNLLLAREKMAELERERMSGNIDETAFEQAREELETGLLEDTEVEETVARVRPASARLAAALVVVLIPALTIGLYMKLGSPQFIGMAGGPAADNPHAANSNGKAPTMAELLVQLEQRMKENPEDAEGWFMLGRVYQSMNRYADAAKAYEELRKLTDDHPQALIALADSLAMVQGGRLGGRPYQLVRQALDKDPNDTTALWLAGQGAMEMADYQNAIYYWRQAEAGLAKNPQYVQELRALIEKARERAAAAGIELDDPGSSVASTAAPAVASTASISLRISLSPTLQDKVSPDDRLFIFAKQVSGRPMPVAAVRLTAADLPAEVVLDDSSMLQAGSKLSDYPQLKVMARISKGSQPMAASGDLQSREAVVSVADGKPVELSIDQLLP